MCEPFSPGPGGGDRPGEPPPLGREFRPEEHPAATEGLPFWADLAPGGGSPRHVVVDLIQDTLPFNYPAFVKVRHTVVVTHDGLRNRFFVLRPSLYLRHSPGDAGLRGFCLPVGSNTPDPG